MGLIELFQEAFKGSETPPEYARWGGISAVSCFLGRNTPINRGSFKLYPNFYTVMVGPAGAKKSTSGSLIQKLNSRLATPQTLVSSGGSMHALMKALAESDPADRCEGYSVIAELNNLLNHNTYQCNGQTILTDLWDCSDYGMDWRTVGVEYKPLTNIWWGFISCATPSLLRNIIPSEANTDGVTSRMIFVQPQRLMPPVPTPPPYNHLMPEMERLANIYRSTQGEFRLSQDANTCYEQYYIEWHDHWFRGDETLAGYWQRKWSHGIKLAAIHAMDTRQVLVVEAEDVEWANKELVQIEKRLPLILGKVAMSKAASMTEKVGQYIWRRFLRGKNTTSRKLSQNLWRGVEKGERYRAVQDLADQGLITISRGDRGGETYKWTGPIQMEDYET